MGVLKSLLSGSGLGADADPSGEDGGYDPGDVVRVRDELTLVTPIDWPHFERSMELIGMDAAKVMDDFSHVADVLEDDPPDVGQMQAFVESVFEEDSLQIDVQGDDGVEQTKLDLRRMPAGACDFFFAWVLQRFLMNVAGDVARARIAFTDSSSGPESPPKSWTIPMNPST